MSKDPTVPPPDKRNIAKPQMSSSKPFGKTRSAKKPREKRNKQLNDENFDLKFEQELTKGRSMGGKRGQISINHLLEFDLPAHERLELPGKRGSCSRRRSSNRAHVSLSGASYINVNYKFIVDSRGDYRTQILDPSVPIDRSLIHRVILPKNDTQCPICLGEDVVAPRMVNCGHVFCLVCLLRFLDSDEIVKEQTHRANKYKECPLCSTSIKPLETLGVLINHIDERFEKPLMGEEVVLQLMFRPKSKLLALPYQLKLSSPDVFQGSIPWIKDDASPQNYVVSNPYVQFSRIMKCDSDFVKRCFVHEIDDINRQSEEDKLLFNDSDAHSKKAVQEIQLAVESLPPSSFQDVNHVETLIDRVDDLKLDGLTQLQRQTQQSEDGYFFYQTSFNSRVKFFLSPLDVNILKTLYGAYSLFPLVLKMKLANVNYDYGVVTEDLINKHRFLGHLPIGTEVGFLELNWLEDRLLPKDVFQVFKKHLLERSRKLEKRKQREDHDKARFEKELELKTLQFYSTENKVPLDDYTRRAEPIEFPEALGHESSHEANFKTTKTIWGTSIIEPQEESLDDDDDWDANVLLQQSRDKQRLKKERKNKKKLVIL